MELEISKILQKLDEFKIEVDRQLNINIDGKFNI